MSANQLRAQVRGEVFAPGDVGYDEHRLAWDRNTDQHPALILIASDAGDVAAGVRFAGDAGLCVAAQSTGHGVQHPANGALLILTSRLKGIEVDPAASTARVSAGTIWHEALLQTAPHGLAPLVGSSPHVGVVGYTLGGGVGWLSRRFGLAVDAVRSVDVVTADGVLRHASASDEIDLFWAVRGGGGNFGVVTALEVDLVPVPTVYGGSLSYPADQAGDALRFFRTWIETLPDELTSSITVVKYPAVPALPEALRGQTHVVVRAAYAGPEAAGAAWIKPWLTWRAPIATTFRQMPVLEIGAISNDPVDPAPVIGSHEMLDALGDRAIDTFVRFSTDPTSPLVYCELRHAGGAIGRVSADATAIGHRSATFYLQMGGRTPTPEAHAAATAYIARFKAALRPDLRGNVLLNFLKGKESTDRVTDAFEPATLERLRAVKRRYDPDNLFRFSFELVPPT